MALGLGCQTVGTIMTHGFLYIWRFCYGQYDGFWFSHRRIPGFDVKNLLIGGGQDRAWSENAMLGPIVTHRSLLSAFTEGSRLSNIAPLLVPLRNGRLSLDKWHPLKDNLAVCWRCWKQTGAKKMTGSFGLFHASWRWVFNSRIEGMARKDVELC